MPNANNERRERDYWEMSESERPDAWSLDLLTHKMSEARVFLEKFNLFRTEFDRATTVLELGGGQCWASCLVQHELGSSAQVFATDIAHAAVVSRHRWEQVVGSRLPGSLACRSYEIPVRDDSIDLIFAFAAAHHFGAHRRTMAEIARVLAPGGVALYVHEPACRPWVYPLAFRRVNAKRPIVPEDVLRTKEIEQIATECGLEAEVRLAPTTTYRGPRETVYYLALQRMPFLQRWLPCTVDIVLRNPDALAGLRARS